MAHAQTTKVSLLTTGGPSLPIKTSHEALDAQVINGFNQTSSEQIRENPASHSDLAIIEKLLRGSVRFKAIWGGKGVPYWSPSEYDFHAAMMAARGGCSDDGLMNLIVDLRNRPWQSEKAVKKSTRKDYLVTTITNVRAAIDDAHPQSTWREKRSLAGEAHGLALDAACAHTRLVTEKSTNSVEALVLIQMVWYSTDGNKVSVARKQLASDLNLSVRSITTYWQKLQLFGCIEQTRSGTGRSAPIFKLNIFDRLHHLQ
ncbi:MAG: hypothetical protein O2974_11440 [Chloroflexi bacterium]|nr:hypothetical protein [Chloroflexota bacterium]